MRRAADMKAVPASISRPPPPADADAARDSPTRGPLPRSHNLNPLLFRGRSPFPSTPRHLFAASGRSGRSWRLCRPRPSGGRQGGRVRASGGQTGGGATPCIVPTGDRRRKRRTRGHDDHERHVWRYNLPFGGPLWPRSGARSCMRRPLRPPLQPRPARRAHRPGRRCRRHGPFGRAPRPCMVPLSLASGHVRCSACTMARMRARTASGRCGHAAMTACRSGLGGVSPGASEGPPGAES